MNAGVRRTQPTYLRMQFALHYSGKLRSRDTASGKHAIRCALAPQLRSLCGAPPFDLVFKGNEGDVSNGKGEPLYVTHGAKKFWFLVSEFLGTVADLRITLFVPHAVGQIVHNGGDIDNRIKTLIDALRAPAAHSEIPANDSFDYSAAGMHCLLQDDKLIGRLSIQSYQDHAPEHPDHVRAFIEVETRITRALWGNLHFV